VVAYAPADLCTAGQGVRLGSQRPVPKAGLYDKECPLVVVWLFLFMSLCVCCWQQFAVERRGCIAQAVLQWRRPVPAVLHTCGAGVGGHNRVVQVLSEVVGLYCRCLVAST
jgi:hypothetical protein